MPGGSPRLGIIPLVEDRVSGLVGVSNAVRDVCLDACGCGALPLVPIAGVFAGGAGSILASPRLGYR